jgi:hypothetical protein
MFRNLIFLAWIAYSNIFFDISVYVILLIFTNYKFINSFKIKIICIKIIVMRHNKFLLNNLIFRNPYNIIYSLYNDQTASGQPFSASSDAVFCVLLANVSCHALPPCSSTHHSIRARSPALAPPHRPLWLVRRVFLLLYHAGLQILEGDSQNRLHFLCDG